MSFGKWNSCFQSFKLGIQFSGCSCACQTTSRIICPSPKTASKNVTTSGHPILLSSLVCFIHRLQKTLPLTKHLLPFHLIFTSNATHLALSPLSLAFWIGWFNFVIACSCFKVRRDSKGSPIKTGRNFAIKAVLNSSQDWFVLLLLKP